MENAKTQRRAAVIGLAVAATVSVVSVTWTRLNAEATTPDSAVAQPADAAASDSDLLKQAAAQYKAKQYEDAKATLAQINSANLSRSEVQKLDSVGVDVEKALAGRTEARARFEEAEAAKDAGNLGEATQLYKNARDNKFADDATKQKAREQIAAVQYIQEQKAAELKAQYQQAKKDYEAGNLEAAKTSFEQLNQAGYKAPMFQGSPSDYLKKIDQKTAAGAAAGEAAPASDEAEKRAAEEQAKAEAQRQADEQKTAEDQAKAEKRAAEEQAKAEKKAAEEAAKAQQQKAKDAYAAGLAALKAKDFATARSQFQAADEAGFKPGLFQAPAAKMLAEVDKEEAKAQAVAAEQPAQPEAPQAQAPAADEAEKKAAEEQAKAEKKAAEEQAKAAEEQAKAEKKAAEEQAKAEKRAAEDQAKAEKRAAEEQAKAEKKAAEEAAKAQQQKAKDAYAAGLAALKAKDFATARSQFQAADEAGFKPGLFQAPAAKMLAEVDKEEAKAQAVAAEQPAQPEAPQAQAPAAEQPQAVAPAAEAPKAEAPAAQQPAVVAPPAETPVAEAPTAEAPKAEAPAAPEAPAADAQAAKQAYAAGVAALKAGDYATARTQFQAADAAGFKPGLFEASAAKMLAKVDQAEADAKARAERQTAAQAQKEEAAKAEAERKAAAAQAKAEKEAAEAQAKAEKKAAEEQARAERAAAKAQAQAEKAAAAEKQIAARQQYKAGLNALRAGDYPAARAAFKAADEGGFKPGLFEAPAAKMLVEVDREEAKAQAKAEQPVAEAPKAEQPVAEAPKAEAPVVEAPKAEQPVVEAPKAEQPVVEVPKAEQPKAEEPVVVEAPKAEQPVTEAPKAEAPKAEAPAVAPAQSELEATAKMEQIRQQARAYDAQRLVDQAQKAQQEGRMADALDLYTQAVEKDPSNQAAVDGRNQLLAVQGRPPVTTGLLTEQERRNRAIRESITYTFNESIDRARAAIAQNNFRVAQQQLDSAAVARQTNPGLFSQDQLRAFDTVLAQVQVELKSDQQRFEAAERQRLAEEAERAARAREEARERETRATVSALIKDARRYISQDRYREALATIDQILVVDPTNDYATGVRPLVEDRALLQAQRGFHEMYDRELVKQLTAAQEKKIPYDDMYRYPTNWPAISDARDRLVEEEKGVGEADRAVRSALERRQPQVRFDGTAFDEVIDSLRDITGVNILVNWKQLEQAGIDRKTPVQARLRDVKLSKVLDEVLRQVSTDPTNRLTYTVDEGVITISTLAELSGNVVTRVYEVTDLMADATALDIGGGGGGGGGGRTTGGGGRSTGGGGRSTGGGGRSTGGGGGGRTTGGGGGGRTTGGGGGGGSLFGGGGGGGGGRTTGGGGGGGGGGDVSGRMDEITDLLISTVEVNSWEDAGGTGTIRPFYQNLQLIISQTPEVHRQIESLLAQLRERSAIQVNVETRFLTVSRNFLEDVGMDFDVTWDPQSDHWLPMTFTQDSIQFTANPQTGVPGSLGAQAPALQFSGAYIDDFQVNFLVRATQATVTQSVVTAPRVTVFNGGTAYVNVSTDRNYVSGFEDATVPGGTGRPIVDVVSDGVYMEVSAFVSHDRKYVRLQLYPNLQKLLGIDVFTFQQAASAVSAGDGTVVSSGAPTQQLQQPQTQTIDMATDVSVPDGGTVLLGGQTIAGEVEREMGVPVLSKLPIIKRFFTNRSMAKDETILLVLVKPTIIIAKEQEQKQFPLLSSKISGQ